jgi:mono/diheme cytochrome c family protein
MTRQRITIVGAALAVLAVVGLALLFFSSGGRRAQADPQDLAGGRTPADFPQVGDDVFKPMDGAIDLTPNEIRGRNTWILWTGGNEQFWDRLSRESYGIVELLKTIDSRNRSTRFHDMGLVNEPGTKQAAKPDQFGLWIDEIDDAYVSPPGVPKSTDPKVIDPNVYGRPTGIVGLRLYPNPNFNEDARKRWDPEKFYTDQKYYLDPTIVRPYRVGMTCGFCHVAPHPLNPPADPENPKWENLASVIGNQYFKEGAVFGYDINRAPKEGKKQGEFTTFFYEVLQTQPPGTSDTSRIATDHNNNPNAMNPIFNVGARLKVAEHEEITGGALNLPGGKQEFVPHILKDGADSVGVPGATIRVYVNIGMFHQQWLECHEPLLGLRPVAGSPATGIQTQKPFDVAKAHQNSVYWQATEQRLENVKLFFLRIKPMHLADAPGGKDYLTKDAQVLDRGKLVFAQECVQCHSSKQPPPTVKGDDQMKWFQEAVRSADFLEDNFLSDDRRHDLKEIGTNAARAAGSNASANHVWDNFSSKTYKDLPSIGVIKCANPADPGKPYEWKVPAGGPGYYRTPSLVSIWSSAPFFHNNALGKFTGDPSVKGRMDAFDDAIRKLLWPGKRENIIWRTKNRSYLEIAKPVLPDFLQELAVEKDALGRPVLKLGPIPANTPVNLLTNIDPDFTQLDGDRIKGALKLAKLCARIKRDLLEIEVKKLDDTQAAEVMKNLVPDLMELSKCPDLVEDKGHRFGTDLGDADKEALIEFLKTL